MNITDPIAYNLADTADRLFADKRIVEEYLSTERRLFYKKVMYFVRSCGVEFNGRDIVDVGCGTGHFLACIANSFHPKSLTALDHSAQALELVRTSCPTAITKDHDIYTCVHEKYDVVFALEVLEHLLAPAQALARLLEMLRTGGNLIVTVPDGRKDTFMGHIHFWSPESWPTFISENCGKMKTKIGIIPNHGANYAIITMPSGHD